MILYGYTINKKKQKVKKKPIKEKTKMP